MLQSLENGAVVVSRRKGISSGSRYAFSKNGAGAARTEHIQQRWLLLVDILSGKPWIY
jgi:hypothetical protein